jgi:hypothetical protein
MRSTTIVTVACFNYLPHAMLLAESCRKHMLDFKIVLCLLEEQVPIDCLNNQCFDQIILAKDLQIPAFRNFIFKHNILEGSTAIKASLLKYLFATSNVKNLIYLDPDILVFSPFEEVLMALNTHSIIVTPHHLVDERSYEATRDNVFRTLKCGIFNLGFLALARTKITYDFLDWWEHRLMNYCHIDFDRGLFVDQKWLDLAPCFFDVHILKHCGYNVANWNVSQRTISIENRELSVNGCALRFFHFSGIETGKDLRILNKYCDKSNVWPLIRRREYLDTLEAIGRKKYSKMGWSYGKYYSEERILDDARLCFRMNQVLQTKFPDPFEFSNIDFISVGW